MIQSSFKILAFSAVLGMSVYFYYNYMMPLLTPNRLLEFILVIRTIGIAFVVCLLVLYVFKIEEL